MFLEVSSLQTNILALNLSTSINQNISESKISPSYWLHLHRHLVLLSKKKKKDNTRNFETTSWILLTTLQNSSSVHFFFILRGSFPMTLFLISNFYWCFPMQIHILFLHSFWAGLESSQRKYWILLSLVTVAIGAKAIQTNYNNVF